MDESTGTSKERIRALGQIRLSAGARNETQALTLKLEDPEVRSTAERQQGRRGLSRKNRVLVGSLIALAGVGMAVPAAAITSWLARTGEFGDPSTSTEVDKTEWISLGADDAPQVVVDSYPDYLTLPEGVPPGAAIASVSRIFAKLSADAGGQARAQEGLMTQTYESFAICAWTGDWLAAQKASDSKRADVAAQWLSTTDNFRTIVANDGGGVTDSLLSFAAGARGGDVKLVEKSYTQQVCDQMLGGGKQ